MPDSMAVIEMYLYEASRGRTLPDGFRDQLLGYLQELSRPVKVNAKRERYWTIPNYARKIGVEPHTLMKRIRRLGEIAQRLLPNRAPIATMNRTRALLPDEIQAIRAEYSDSAESYGVDVREIAKQHGITPARVGQLCRDLKQSKQARRAAIQNSLEAQPVGWDDEAL